MKNEEEKRKNTEEGIRRINRKEEIEEDKGNEEIIQEEKEKKKEDKTEEAKYQNGMKGGERGRGEEDKERFREGRMLQKQEIERGRRRTRRRK